MAKKPIKSKPSADSGPITTAAGLARKLGVHRATITRRAHKKGLAEKLRVGHQIMLTGANQSALRKGAAKGRPKGS